MRTTPWVAAPIACLWLFGSLLLPVGLPGYVHAQTVTYHLHKESSATRGLLQLKTEGPDYRATAFQSAELKNQLSGEYLIKAFETQAGVPNASGLIPQGSTVNFVLWMKKTSDYGVIYPQAKLHLNSGSGPLLCNGIGGAPLTTTLSQHTFTCATASTISITTADRLFLSSGVSIATAPGANRVKGELDIEGMANPSYDSRITVPLPVPAITSLAPTAGPAGTSIIITGSGFGATQGSSTISFNGITATASSWSDTTVVTTVPVGATTGMVVVRGGGGPSNGLLFAVDVAPGVIVTLAGNGGGFFGGDGGPAPSARLYEPSGVATDGLGNVYIADTSNHRVRKVGPDGVISTVAGTGVSGYSGDGGPAISARLWYPFDVAVDGQGNLFICDKYNSRIRKVSPGGTIITVAGSGAGFAGDTGPATSAKLNYPEGIAITSFGDLYIADTGNERVRRVDTSGRITTVAGTGNWGYNGDNRGAVSAYLNRPTDVAAGSTGTIYIADSQNHRIRKVTSGIITTVAGDGTSGFGGDGGPATSAQVAGPRAVVSDSFGELLIAESNRIRRVDTTGTITTVAGNGTYGFSGDGGPAVNAQLAGPSGVTWDRQHSIVIADYYNNRIRKIGGPPPPSMTSISPLLGPVETMVTITGSRFGAAQGANFVSFNGVRTTAASWSDTNILAPVPLGATKGMVEVFVEGVPSNPLFFKVTPKIDALMPSGGLEGTDVTITGWNLTAENEESALTFNGVTAFPTSVSATRLVAPVPGGATTGPVVVTVGGNPSNGVNFKVQPPPAISSLSPVGGGVGSSVTINGTFFGATQGNSTVTFNGQMATPTTWSDTGIVVPVPAGATTGPVVVTVDGLSSNGKTFAVLSLTITIPANGEIINRPNTVVMGRLPDWGGDLTVVVNDRLAMVNGRDFAINGVDLSLGDTTITATMTDQAGLTVTANVLVRTESQDAYLDMTAGLEASLTTMTTDVMLESFFSSPVTETVVDITGPGPSYTTIPGLPSGVRVSLYSPGMYLVTVTARTAAGPYANRLAFRALDPTATETLLRQKWDAMWSALLAGNVDGALTYFATRSHERYRSIFTELQPSLPQLYGGIESFHLLSVTNDEAEAEAVRTEEGIPYSYPINYYWGEDGIWKLRQF